MVETRLSEFFNFSLFPIVLYTCHSHCSASITIRWCQLKKKHNSKIYDLWTVSLSLSKYTVILCWLSLLLLWYFVKYKCCYNVNCANLWFCYCSTLAAQFAVWVYLRQCMILLMVKSLNMWSLWTCLLSTFYHCCMISAKSCAN